MHPNVVGALGRPAAAQDAQLCNIISYEIKQESLTLLNGGKFMPIPDPHSSYDFTLPPISPDDVARVHPFATCPADRPVTCATTGLCVTVAEQCGAVRPSTGIVTKTITTDPYQAAAREIKVKYLLQQQQQQKRHAQLARRYGYGYGGGLGQPPDCRWQATESQRRVCLYVLFGFIAVVFLVVLVAGVVSQRKKLAPRYPRPRPLPVTPYQLF